MFLACSAYVERHSLRQAPERVAQGGMFEPLIDLTILQANL